MQGRCERFFLWERVDRVLDTGIEVAASPAAELPQVSVGETEDVGVAANPNPPSSRVAAWKTATNSFYKLCKSGFGICAAADTLTVYERDVPRSFAGDLSGHGYAVCVGLKRCYYKGVDSCHRFASNQCLASFGGFGSTAGEIVFELRKAPFRPWIVTSPPPAF